MIDAFDGLACREPSAHESAIRYHAARNGGQLRQFTITACAGKSAYSASVPSFHERSDDEFVGLDAVRAKAGVDSRSASAAKIPSWHIEDNLTLVQQMGVAKVAS